MNKIKIENKISVQKAKLLKIENTLSQDFKDIGKVYTKFKKMIFMKTGRKCGQRFAVKKMFENP